MKILTNKKIKSLFCVILFCMITFTLISMLLTVFKIENAAALIFAAALAVFAAIIIDLYRYFSKQNKIIEKAETQITEYIAGNMAARIECDEEGELYKLFHKVNSLAAILNAHVEKETNSKEFLKNTISDISHQLKTPLAAMNIYNGIMQDEGRLTGNTGVRFPYGTGVDRIETLVQNLLKITKLDAGTISLDKRTENVSVMMKEIKNHFMFRANREGKQIDIVGDDNITLLV